MRVDLPRSINPERLVSGLAIVVYAAATFASLWMLAHADAQDPVGDGTNDSTVFLACVVCVAFLLPLLTGFAVGRWWAVTLVLWLFLAARVADGLEPPQGPPPGEFVPGWEAAAAIIGCLHILLLLAGVGLRTLIRPRPPAEPWTTRLT